MHNNFELKQKNKGKKMADIVDVLRKIAKQRVSEGKKLAGKEEVKDHMKELKTLAVSQSIGKVKIPAHLPGIKSPLNLD